MKLRNLLYIYIIFCGFSAYGVEESKVCITTNKLNCCSYKTNEKANEIDRCILSKLCSEDTMKKLNMSDEKAKELKDKLCGLELKEINYCKQVNLLGDKQLKLLMDDELNEKELYKLTDEIGELKIKIAKIKIESIILLKKSFAVEQLKQLK
ncbi:MAG: hypothetical protein PF692_01400 [Kiritimatiellae bacterium]|jgi:hypothetical protein|nr:hypothetical protein [Kiritimatiellia bacterium]